MTTGDGEGPQSPASIAPSLQASQQEGLVGENPATCPPLASLLANTQRIESGPPGLPGGVLSLFSKVGSTGGQGGGLASLAGHSLKTEPVELLSSSPPGLVLGKGGNAEQAMLAHLGGPPWLRQRQPRIPVSVTGSRCSAARAQRAPCPCYPACTRTGEGTVFSTTSPTRNGHMEESMDVGSHLPLSQSSVLLGQSAVSRVSADFPPENLQQAVLGIDRGACSVPSSWQPS